MLEDHHIESAKTYGAAIMGVTIPAIISVINPVLQFLSLLGGLYLILLRIKYEKGNKN